MINSIMEYPREDASMEMEQEFDRRVESRLRDIKNTFCWSTSSPDGKR